jgi:hypothetical protein
MNRIALLLVAGATLAGLVAAMAPSSQEGHRQDKPAVGEQPPAGYRDWRLISVAREEGELDDIRAVLGNDAAIKTYRDGKRPFPDGHEDFPVVVGVGLSCRQCPVLHRSHSHHAHPLKSTRRARRSHPDRR